MQYVGKVGGYMYNQWSSLNPATLLGAIDIIVIEQPDGTLHCSPFHVRFGKFQIIKPLQKKIDFFVNENKTDLPMKLGDGGEAFFVFQTDRNNLISKSALTSPVISPVSSPEISPSFSPSGSTLDLNNDMEELDLNQDQSKDGDDNIETKIQLDNSPPPTGSPRKGVSPAPSSKLKIAFERAMKVTKKLNIPSKIDNNGDVVLDMDGYKPNSQKNIDSSDELLKKIFLEELEKLSHEKDNESKVNLWDQIIKMDKDGNIRITNLDGQTEETVPGDEPYTGNILLDQQDLTDNSSMTGSSGYPSSDDDSMSYFKTLRLTSDQLKQMNLKYGENKLMFKLNQSNSQVYSNLYLWKSTSPIVISDIDGTITKSDALGHVLNFIGRDWTHEGVARLFQDIHANGYNIIYLTARSVGQADSTRQYLQSIVQENGIRLPEGPVILSPDRTMAALKREVILKKPEVFKMSCLNDIKSLYYTAQIGGDEIEDERTPFYAGFGNRITDAISYRSVKIPSHRIFTINPNGEVHMELLELSGVKSSYLDIGQLVDQYFPPVSFLSGYTDLSNITNAENAYLTNRSNFTAEERFNDVNYWREPINLSDLSDIEDDEEPEQPKSPSLLSIRSFGFDKDVSEKKDRKERPKSGSSFTSPLKGFMNFSNSNEDFDSSYDDSILKQSDKLQNNVDTDDYDEVEEDDRGVEEEDDDDDYDDDDYDEEADLDYESGEDDYDESASDSDNLDDIEDEDLDYDDGLPKEDHKPIVSGQSSPSKDHLSQPNPSKKDLESAPVINKASELLQRD